MCGCLDGCSEVVAPGHVVCSDCGGGTVWLRSFPRDIGPGWFCLVCRVVWLCVPGRGAAVLRVGGLFDDGAAVGDCLRAQVDLLRAQGIPGV